MTPDDFWRSAFEQPLSPVRTSMEAFESGMLDSYGLGTAIKDTFIPDGNSPRSYMALTLPGVGPAYEGFRALVQSHIDEDEPTLSEEDYKNSRWFREAIPYDQGMTPTRAAALADWHDQKAVREFYSQKRPITAFFGNLGGQALDPINYIPLAGPAVRAAAVARFGRVVGSALLASGEAAAATGIASLATAGERARYGDDTSWQVTVSEIAMAALIGGAFGTLSGVLGRTGDAKIAAAKERAYTLNSVQKARLALNEAISYAVRGDDLNLSPNSAGVVSEMMAKVVSDAAEQFTFVPRSAADESSPMSVAPGAGQPAVVYNGKVYVAETHEAAISKVVAQNGEDAAQALAAAPDSIGYAVASSRRSLSEMATPVERAIWLENNPASVQAATLQRQQAIADIERYSRSYSAGERPHRRFLRWAELTNPNGHYLLPDMLKGASRKLEEAEAILAGHRAGLDPRQLPPVPLPDGREAAERAIGGRLQDNASFAKDLGVDHITGEFAEMEDIERLRELGRLTPEDEAILAEAADDFERAIAFGQAIKAAVFCASR